MERFCGGRDDGVRLLATSKGGGPGHPSSAQPAAWSCPRGGRDRAGGVIIIGRRPRPASSAAAARRRPGRWPRSPARSGAPRPPSRLAAAERAASSRPELGASCVPSAFDAALPQTPPVVAAYAAVVTAAPDATSATSVTMTPESVFSTRSARGRDEGRRGGAGWPGMRAALDPRATLCRWPGCRGLRRPAGQADAGHDRSVPVGWRRSGHEEVPSAVKRMSLSLHAHVCGRRRRRPS